MRTFLSSSLSQLRESSYYYASKVLYRIADSHTLVSSEMNPSTPSTAVECEEETRNVTASKGNHNLVQGIPLDIRLEIYAMIDVSVMIAVEPIELDRMDHSEHYVRPKDRTERQLFTAAIMNDIEVILELLLAMEDNHMNETHGIWDSLCCILARFGNCEMLHWLCTKKNFTVPQNTTMLRAAALGGSCKLLQLLCSQGSCPWNEGMCSSAAYGGQLELLKWLRSQRFPWDESTCSWAAMNGHLHVLQWAREKGCPWDERTCSKAAMNGHLQILQWAHEHGCPWDEETCCFASHGNHLEILRWAHEQGCPWDVETCHEAAENGHLEVLQWAHEHGCPWNQEVCSLAAMKGHLEILQWAYNQGCPWDEQTCINAAYNGHVQILKWAYQQGCPWDENQVMNGLAYYLASNNGDDSTYY